MLIKKNNSKTKFFKKKTFIYFEYFKIQDFLFFHYFRYPLDFPLFPLPHLFLS